MFFFFTSGVPDTAIGPRGNGPLFQTPDVLLGVDAAKDDGPEGALDGPQIEAEGAALDVILAHQRVEHVGVRRLPAQDPRTGA